MMVLLVTHRIDREVVVGSRFEYRENAVTSNYIENEEMTEWVWQTIEVFHDVIMDRKFR